MASLVSSSLFRRRPEPRLKLALKEGLRLDPDLRRNRGLVQSWCKGKRMAVLKGGWSRERSISLKTGAAMEASLRRLGLRFESIDITPASLARIQKNNISFCWLALHGAYGEDGRLQGALDYLGIPYSGCGALASALAMDKPLSKAVFREAGVPVPAGEVVSRSEWESSPASVEKKIRALLKRRSLFVKPVDQGSALGAAKLEKPSALSSVLSACFHYSDRALIEEFVDGRELTVGIVGDWALPVVEIIPEHAFYDFHSKYATGGSRHLAPAPLSAALTKKCQQEAWNAYRALGCSVYGRVDLLLPANKSVKVLEVNTIPGMTETSLLPDAARAAGLSFDEVMLAILHESLIERGVWRRAKKR